MILSYVNLLDKKKLQHRNTGIIEVEVFKTVAV
ncbi:MAG: hypothetical protein BWX92_03133 [Deltaproteobacteria bacterium ADurb.Bin135]|nr:MAG: hypothetical protein BWX92_03133 [Deltaproteobacteria bacterium ADurb.Bin135]